MPVSFLLPCHDLLPGASLPTAGRTLRSLALRWALLEALRHGPSTTCHFGRLIPLPHLGRTTCRPSGSDTEQGWVSKKIGVISNMKRFHTVWGAQLARTGMEPYQVSETSYSISAHSISQGLKKGPRPTRREASISPSAQDTRISAERARRSIFFMEVSSFTTADSRSKSRCESMTLDCRLFLGFCTQRNTYTSNEYTKGEKNQETPINMFKVVVG